MYYISVPDLEGEALAVDVCSMQSKKIKMFNNMGIRHSFIVRVMGETLSENRGVIKVVKDRVYCDTLDHSNLIQRHFDKGDGYLELREDKNFE